MPEWWNENVGKDRSNTMIKSKTLPKVKVHGPTLDRVDCSVVADALGAERIEGSVAPKQGPIALFGLRQVLADDSMSSCGGEI